MELYTVFKITYSVKLHTVCKIKHWVKKYSLCVKSHTVCEITHILQDSTGVRDQGNLVPRGGVGFLQIPQQYCSTVVL